MLWRQGDVLIESVEEDTVPEGGESVVGGVLAQGEATGHRHQVEDPKTVEMWRFDSMLYLKVLALKRVIHEEHEPISLEPGTYRVWQQREYVPPRQRGQKSISFRTVRD